MILSEKTVPTFWDHALVRQIAVLITGFGPFPGAPFNPTGALVTALLRARRPALGRVRLAGHVFRTSYAAVDEELPALIERERPDVLLMFGLATRTKFLRIETCARNACSALLSDVGGILPRGRRICPGGASVLRGRAPMAQLLVAARKTGVPVRTSHNAGRYLCNYLYWRAAELEQNSAPKIVVFVHVPQIRRVPRRHIAKAKPGITLPDLNRAGEAILRTLLTAARH